MKNKCKYCFSRFREDNSVCGVCKIDALKKPAELTADEKKIAYRCRTLYTVGFLTIVGSLISLFILLPAIFFYLRGARDTNLVEDSAFLPFYVIAMLILIVVGPFYGLALRRYKRGCYPAGIVLYLSFALVNVPFIQIGPVVTALFFLYWIASPPSRQILIH